jgi:hypothetical protein
MSNKPISAVEVEGFNRLTPREQAFVQHPDVYRDPKKAATEVGYSSSTIEKRAHSMRQRLMRFIQPAFEARLSSVGVDRRKVEEELALIGFVDVTDYQETIDIEMADGGFQSVVVWKDPMQLPAHMRKAIRSVEYGTITTADDETLQSDRPIRVTFHSKEKALHELAGLFGDMAPINPANEQQQLFDNLDIADRETLVRIHMKAARRAALKDQPIEGTNAQREEPVRRLVAPVESEASGRSDVTPRDADRSRPVPRDQPADAAVPPARRRVGNTAPRRARAIPAGPLPDGGESDVGFSDLPG